MRFVTMALVTALGASVAGNALLGRALRAPAAAAGPGEAEAPALPSQAPLAASTAAPVPGATAAATPSPCDERIALVEQQVAREEEALRASLPPDQLFARGLPNPGAERQLHPLLARALGDDRDGQRRHSLECRDTACKLVFEEAAGAGDEAWDEMLTRDPGLRGWTAGASVAAATPIPGRAEPAVERTVYFKLNGPLALALGR
jgi:hypothetical protein